MANKFTQQPNQAEVILTNISILLIILALSLSF